MTPPLFRYIQTCQHYQQQLEALGQQAEGLSLTARKAFKEIDKEIGEELRRARERGAQAETTVPSFVGMQIKNYMGGGQDREEVEPKQLKKLVDKSAKKLRSSVRAFLGEL